MTDAPRYDLDALSLTDCDLTDPAEYDTDPFPRPDVIDVGHGVRVYYTSPHSDRQAGSRFPLNAGGYIREMDPHNLLIEEYERDARNDPPRVFLVDTTALRAWSFTEKRRTPLGIVERISHDKYPNEDDFEARSRQYRAAVDAGHMDRVRVTEGPYVHFDDESNHDPTTPERR
jgi:hypothetical protein